MPRAQAARHDTQARRILPRRQHGEGHAGAVVCARRAGSEAQVPRRADPDSRRRPGP